MTVKLVEVMKSTVLTVLYYVLPTVEVKKTPTGFLNSAYGHSVVIGSEFELEILWVASDCQCLRK